MSAKTTEAVAHRLAHFPVTLFATVLGLAGLTLALQHAERLLDWPQVSSMALLVITIADFVLLSTFYALKALRHPKSIASEWRHPVKLSFFPAISISLMLIATALRAVLPDVAHVIWVIGAVAQLALTLAVISGWIGHRPFQPVQISPAWFIPAVGNVVAPVAGVSFGYIELSWLFFATGLIFWVVLLTLVMNRLIFHDPLPAKLLPTLVILIAPPAVAFLAWLQLNGGVLDPLARVLYYGGVVFAAIVAVQAAGFARLPFALSWWALSFPVAALTLATFRYGELSGHAGYKTAGAVLLCLLLAIIAGLAHRTLKAAMADQICVPD